MCCSFIWNRIHGSTWIGLTKSKDNCPSGKSDSDYFCRRTGWTWADGTPYTFPVWHDWYGNEPDANDLCGLLNFVQKKWTSDDCEDDERNFVCERGNVFNIFIVNEICCIAWHLYLCFLYLNHSASWTIYLVLFSTRYNDVDDKDNNRNQSNYHGGNGYFNHSNDKNRTKSKVTRSCKHRSGGTDVSTKSTNGEKWTIRRIINM